MQWGCLSDLGYLFSSLGVWQCQRLALYLVLASVPHHWRRIFVQLGGEFMWIHVHKSSMALETSYMTTSTLNWTRNICSTGFDFVDWNIASCNLLLSKYPINTCIMTVVGKTPWPWCEGILKANPMQNQAAREEWSATSSYQLFRSCNRAGREKSEINLMSSQNMPLICMCWVCESGHDAAFCCDFFWKLHAYVWSSYLYSSAGGTY